MSSGGWCTAAATSSSLTSRSIRPERDQPVVQALVRAGRRRTAGRSAAAWRRPSRARRGRGSAPAAAAWPPSPAPASTASGRVSSRSSTDSQRASTSAVWSSTSAPNRSSTYLRASSRYSICSCTAVSVRPSDERDQMLQASGRGRPRAAPRPAARRSGRRLRNRSSIIASTSDGRADLEVGRDLGQVGVADDHVQPAVLLRVGVRLVPGVDDRPLQRGLQARPRPRSSRPAG